MFILLIAGFILATCQSCSLPYVLEAGWQESKILWRRTSITQLLNDPNLNRELKHKLELTKATREFTAKIGLKPEGSFSSYSKVDSKVLVWVINASPKTELTPVSWRFPFVGNVPYKGFFSRHDAIQEGLKLKKQGLDIYLRGSGAFSTLGWFDDPLLSTIASLPDHTLVNTIIHEIVHNTFWFKNHVPFNETLANFIGSKGAMLFFTEQEGIASTNLQKSKNVWHDEMIFAAFLERAYNTLNTFYISAKKSKLPEDEILNKRREIFKHLLDTWKRKNKNLLTHRYDNLANTLNNASILAHKTYLEQPLVLSKAYNQCANTLEEFIRILKVIAVKYNEQDGINPYQLLQDLIKNNCYIPNDTSQ